MELLNKIIETVSILFMPVMAVILVFNWIRDDIAEKKKKKLLLQKISDVKISLKNITEMLRLSLKMNDDLIKFSLKHSSTFTQDEIEELNSLRIIFAKARENYVEVWQEQDKI